METKRNALKTTTESFCVESESEHMERRRISEEYYNSIPTYNGEKPSLDEILVVEKVLKYASECKWVVFTKEDLEIVMGCSTNVLKWGLGYFKSSNEE